MSASSRGYQSGPGMFHVPQPALVGNHEGPFPHDLGPAGGWQGLGRSLAQIVSFLEPRAESDNGPCVHLRASGREAGCVGRNDG